MHVTWNSPVYKSHHFAVCYTQITFILREHTKIFCTNLTLHTKNFQTVWTAQILSYAKAFLKKCVAKKVNYGISNNGIAPDNTYMYM